MLTATEIGYGLGVGLGSYRGLRTLSHSGGDAGYRSYVVWFPGEELGIAILSNLDGFAPDMVANQVAGVYLGTKMTADPAGGTFVDVDPKELESYVGAYPIQTIGQTAHFVMEGGRLHDAGPTTSERYEMKPVGPGRFCGPQLSADYEFTAKPEGGMAVKITQGGVTFEGVRDVSVPAHATTPKDLPQYAGVYWSDELETQYTLSVRDGKLLGVHAHHGEFELTPFKKDQFATKLWFMPDVKFVRDQTGRLTGATFGGYRTKQVDFVRR